MFAGDRDDGLPGGELRCVVALLGGAVGLLPLGPLDDDRGGGQKRVTAGMGRVQVRVEDVADPGGVDPDGTQPGVDELVLLTNSSSSAPTATSPPAARRPAHDLTATLALATAQGL